MYQKVSPFSLESYDKSLLLIVTVVPPLVIISILLNVVSELEIPVPFNANTNNLLLVGDASGSAHHIAEIVLVVPPPSLNVLTPPPNVDKPL